MHLLEITQLFTTLQFTFTLYKFFSWKCIGKFKFHNSLAKTSVKCKVFTPNDKLLFVF